MNICQNKCTPNEYVCTGCGRTEEERLHWHSLPPAIQEMIARRIDIETHLSNALTSQTEEIMRLNGIIAELNNEISQLSKS